jgi:hypothetical protein
MYGVDASPKEYLLLDQKRDVVVVILVLMFSI